MWNTWSEYGDCSVTCGGGRKERVRTSKNGDPGVGGCNGDQTERNICNPEPCCKFMHESI